MVNMCLYFLVSSHLWLLVIPLCVLTAPSRRTFCLCARLPSEFLSRAALEENHRFHFSTASCVLHFFSFPFHNFLLICFSSSPVLNSLPSPPLGSPSLHVLNAILAFFSSRIFCIISRMLHRVICVPEHTLTSAFKACLSHSY